MDKSLIKRFSVLAGANAFALGTQVCAYPIITRLYSPIEFGVFGACVAVATLLGVLLSPRPEGVLSHLPEDEARIYLPGSLIVAFFLPLSVSLIGLSAAPFLCPASWGNFAVSVPFIAALFSVNTVISVWCSAFRKQKEFSKILVMQSLTTVGVQLLLGWSAVGTGGLIFGLVLGQLSSVILFCRFEKSTFTFCSVATMQVWSGLYRRVLSRTQGYWAWSAVWCAVGQSPVLIVQSLYLPAQVGLYFFINRVFNAFSSVVSGSINSIFLGEGNLKPTQLAKLQQRSMTISFILAFLFTGSFVLLGSQGTAAVFGGQWQDLHSVGMALAARYISEITLSSVLATALITRKFRLQITVEGLRLASIFASFIIPVFLDWQFISALWFFSAITAAANCCALYLLRNSVRTHEGLATLQ